MHQLTAPGRVKGTNQVSLTTTVSPAGAAGLEPAERTEAEPGVVIGLFAPRNPAVRLVASWTDWKPVDLERSDDGWWRTRVNLPDGDYEYKFRATSVSYFSLDKEVDVFDPYGVSISEDAEENTILRVRGGKRVDVAYAWKHDDVPLPSNRDLVIYELHVGDFTGGQGDRGRGREYEKGRFKHVAEKLDYLRDLGINCIELLPVKEFPGKGWGYSLRSLFAVENSYGSPEELCRLVDEAHARGMRVLIDGVYNHADSESPLAKLSYEYWYHNPNPDPEELQWGPKFNYGYYDAELGVYPARKYVNESLEFWVGTFHIDGIRFDATRAIADFKVMRELTDVAHRKADGIKPFFTVAEHVPEDPAIVGRDDGAPMDAAWQDGLARLLQAIVIWREVDGNVPTDLAALATKLNPAINGYKRGDRFVNFIGNHDFHRILYLLGHDAGVFDEAAFRRVKLGTALLLTAPGIPMLWMGQEFGFSAAKSLEPRPLDWTLLKNDRNSDLLEFHRKLIAARHMHAAFRADGFHVVLSDTDRSLFGYKRFDEAGEMAVVLANLLDGDAGGVEVSGAGLPDGAYVELIHGDEVSVEGGVLRTTLGPSEAKVFLRRG